MRHACFAAMLAVFLPLMAFVAPACAEGGGEAVAPPMLFAVPRLELAGESRDLLDGIDLGFAVPLSPRTSITGNYVWDANGDDDITATYNFHLRSHSTASARFSAGIIQDEPGLRLSAHRPSERYGTGAFVGTVGGDVQAGVFVSTPLRWGVKLHRSAVRAAGEQAGENVGDLGAIATLGLTVGQGKKAELATGAAWWARPASETPIAAAPLSAARARPTAATVSEFAPPARQAWSFQTRGAAGGGVATSGDRAYVGGREGVVYAVRLADGSPLWTAAVGSEVTAALAGSGDRVYVSTRAGHLIALRPPLLADGIVGLEDWRFGAGAPISMAALETPGGLVVVGAEDGRLCAVDHAGRQMWSFETRGPIIASAALSVKPFALPGATQERGRPAYLVYLASTDGVVYALRERDGKPAWTFATGAPLRAAPVALDTMVVAVNERGDVYAVDAADGHMLWRQTLGDTCRTAPAVADGRAYFACTDGTISALSLTDGRTLWTAEVFGQLVAPPLTPRSPYLLIATGPGMLYALRRGDGRILWAENVGETITTGTALGGHTLVFGSDAGRVHAYVPGGTWHVDPPPVTVTARRDGGARASAPAREQPSPAPGQALKAKVPTAAAASGSFPSPTTAPAELPTTATPQRVAMALLTAPNDPRQPAIQLVDHTSITVCGRVPPDAARLTINDEPVTAHGGQFSQQLTFDGPGAYPVTIRYVDAAGKIRTDHRIVVVSRDEQPTSAAAVFVSPEGGTPGNRVSFTLLSVLDGREPCVNVLEIRDVKGKAIRAWADVSGSSPTFEWDGQDQWGKSAPDGQYVAVYTVRDMEGHSRSLYQPVIVDAAGM